jgi:hypothetical protein
MRQHSISRTRWILAGLAVFGLAMSTSPLGVVRAQSAPGPTALKAEYRVNPIGIDATRPRFSWQLVASGR